MRTGHSLLKYALYAGLLIALLGLPLAPGGLLPDAFAADDKLELSIADDLPMDKFLATVARLTGKTLIWNPLDKNVRGKKVLGGITLTGKRSEFLDMARSLLTFYELVMIPVGPEGYEVQLVMDARQSSSIMKLKPKYVVLNDKNLDMYEKADGVFITTTIKVENLSDLRNARNALTRIVTGQNIGNVTEVPIARAFVVTDFAPNVVAIYRLLRKMDQPNPTSSTTGGETVALPMEHAQAMDVAMVLIQHFAARPSGASGRAPNPRYPSAAISAPRITADARTNQILVTGTPAQIEKIKKTIAQIDVPVHHATQNHRAHLVRLKNLHASETAEVLSRMAKHLFASPDASALPSIVAHMGSSSLIVSSSKTQFEIIFALIQDMDKEPAKTK